MRGHVRRGIFFSSVLFITYATSALCAQDVPFELDPIIVSKRKTHLFNSYCVTQEMQESLAFTSPVEALGVAPIDLQSRSPAGAIQTDFSLRGSTFQGAVVALEGERLNDPQTAHHNSDIPLTEEDIERIDIIPGVSSALFGPDAIGGAVNFTLKKPRVKKTIFKASIGEYKTGSALVSVSEKIGSLGARISIENQESGGFRPGTDFKKATATFYSEYELPAGTYDLSFGYQEKEFGAYDFYTPQSGYFSKEWTKTYLLNTGFDVRALGMRMKPNFLWRRHFDKFMLDKTQIRSNYLNRHRTDVFSPNFYFQKEAGVFGRIGVGTEFGQERIKSTNLGKHSRAHKSIYVDDNIAASSRFSLGFSSRVDDFESAGKSATGSASARYLFSGQSAVSAGVSRSIRVPSFTELYYNDPTTVGNAGLCAERSLNWQLGYEYNNDDVFAGTTFFLRDEQDLIDWIKYTPAQAKWQAHNIAEAAVAGIENSAKIKINDISQVECNYTYIYKRINGQGYLYKYGPNYSRHLLNTVLRLDFPWGTQSLSVSYKQKPQRRGWLLVNPRISRNLNKNCQAFVEVTNLLNVEYQEIEGIPQPGRWAQAGVRFEW